jgi:hypothetical protein
MGDAYRNALAAFFGAPFPKGGGAIHDTKHDREELIHTKPTLTRYKGALMNTGASPGTTHERKVGHAPVWGS